MHKIRLLIADDHPIFRVGLVNVVRQNKNIEIIAETDNGTDALSVIRSDSPDIAVLDIEMPGMNGLEVCEAVIKNKLPTKVLLLTLYKEADLYKRAQEIGAHGYLLKDNAPNELMTAIETIAAGQKYYSSTLSGLLTSTKSHFIKDPAVREVIEKLSNTEKKILKLIAEQKTTKEIASKLFVSEKTVENHRYNISKKLGLEGGQNNLLKFALENKTFLS